MLKKPILPLLAFILLFNSCIGLSVDIQMNRNGSGKVFFEYQISRMVENLGLFDGNESMPAIPISKTDWERTVSRNPGLKLVSYSSKVSGADTIRNVTIEYANEDALKALLGGNYTGKVSINREGGAGTIDISLMDEPLFSNDDTYNENTLSLINNFMKGYRFAISFSATGNSLLALTDKDGTIISSPQTAQAVLTGRKVSFSIDITELYNLNNGLGIRFIW